MSHLNKLKNPHWVRATGGTDRVSSVRTAWSHSLGWCVRGGTEILSQEELLGKMTGIFFFNALRYFVYIGLSCSTNFSIRITSLQSNVNI